MQKIQRLFKNYIRKYKWSQVDEELKDRLTSATKGFEVSSINNLSGDGNDACNIVGDVEGDTSMHQYR